MISEANHNIYLEFSELQSKENKASKQANQLPLIDDKVLKLELANITPLAANRERNNYLLINFIKIAKLFQKKKLEQQPKEALTNIFKEINQTIALNKASDSTFSGSTAVMVYMLLYQIHCANLGDSIAIIGFYLKIQLIAQILSRFKEWERGERNGGQESEKKKLIILFYHIKYSDLKPSEKDELESIIQCGGRIQHFKHINGNFIGPLRVWAFNQNFPGLAMARSIGDQIAQSVGIISEPGVKEYALPNNDRISVIRIHRLLEFLTNDEILQIASQYYFTNQVERATEELLAIAKNSWQKNQKVVDEITILLFFLNY